MVSGEPDSVRVKAINGQWMVRIVESGRLTQQLFDIHAEAEGFAEDERLRLGLPGEPPRPPLQIRTSPRCGSSCSGSESGSGSSTSDDDDDEAT